MTDGVPTCPFCGSAHAELVSAWGGQLITSQWRCHGCNTHFEALRADLGGAGNAGRADGEEAPSTSS